VKQSGMKVSVQQLPEIEIPAAENGIDEPLVEGRTHRNVDRAWLLWESRRFIWHLTVWGLVLTTVAAFLLPKQYVSTARLMPPEKESSSPLAMMAAMTMGESGGSGGGGGGSSLGDVAQDILGTKSEGALYTAVLQGRTIADALIQRFDLRKVYGVKYWEDARKKLASRTDIAEDRKSGVIVIKVRDHDPRRAAQIDQAYVEELNRLIAAVSTSAARRERIFIEQRLKTAKQDLDKAAKEFSEFASQNTAIDIPEQGKAMVAAAAVLQGQLIAARSEAEGLSQIYTDSNVRLRSARARVAEIQRQLVKMGGDNASFGSGVTGPPSNPASVPKDLNSKDLDPADIYPAIRELPLLGVRWADLYLQSKIQEKVYELLTAQYEISKIQEAKETPSVQVFDIADVPEKKSGPPRLLIMSLGAVLSFGIAVGWILGAEAWRGMDSHDPRKQFAKEVGGEIRVAAFQLAVRVRNRFAKHTSSSRTTEGVRESD
jgi:uncharacterized protein involved in exopolysaccharide biosynthesis